jgi:hypothetical protein
MIWLRTAMLRAILLPGVKEFRMWMKLAPIFTVLVSTSLAQPPVPNTNSPDELRARVGAQNAEAKPVPTKADSHRLGETIQEWLAENQMDLAAICASKKRDDKTTCRTLSLFRDGKTGTFDTIDDKKHKYEWLFVDGNVAEATTGAALDFYAGGTHYAASNMDEQIGFLSQVYGPPAKVQTVPYQNARRSFNKPSRILIFINHLMILPAWHPLDHS